MKEKIIACPNCGYVKSKIGKQPPTFKNKQIKYRGVQKDGNMFMAKVKGKYLGSFKTPLEAALVYDKEAFVKFGPLAILNFKKT